MTASLILAGCGNSETTGKVTLSGSSTVAPLAQVIGQKFESENPGMEIDVQTGGSSRGVNDATKGLVDIGMASRALAPEEQENLSPYTIAWDGIAPIVHRDNPVTELSDSQIRGIYTGEIGNWSALGGPDAEIVVVNKAEGRSTLKLFLHYFDLKNSQIAADVVIGDNQQGIKTVAGNPHAIGYVSIGTAEFEASNGTSIRLLPMGGVEASTASVSSGQFPLSRPLNLLVKPDLSQASQRFLDYARSAQVADLVKGQFFVPIDYSSVEH
jgi:phosphate transport system substrate-binding protein